MKKLIVSVFAAVLSLSAFSVTTHWGWSLSTTYLKDGYGKFGDASYTPKTLANHDLYLITAGEGTTAMTTTQTAILKGLAAGTMTIAEIKASAISTGKTDANGQKTTGNVTKFDRTDAEVGTTYQYVLVAFSADEKYIYLSSSKTKIAQVETQIADFQVLVNTSSNNKTRTEDGGFDKAGWYLVAGTSPTPEPTSGVLLLIGMAGLALRRKQKKA